ITISASVDEETLTINVSDTGRGISGEQLNVIFEPFQQGNDSLSRDVDGVGIGLSITKNLVRLHGGKLDVSSKVGEGSTFSVSLPVHDGISHEEEVAVTTESTLIEETELLPIAHQTEKTKSTILVVDDEKI